MSTTEEIATTTPLDAAKLRLGVLTVLQTQVSEAVGAVRVEVHGLTTKGETHVIAHPDDPAREIASVNHSKPKRKAEVTDVGAVDAWIKAEYPGKTETKTKILGSARDVLDVLREHAPFLLEDEVVVPDWARTELVLKSATAGEPVGFGGEIGEKAPPGIRVWTPDGVLKVTVAPTAVEVVNELWLDQRVDMDGNLLALPAGGTK